MLPKAILFDLDDTILTEESAGDIAWERICELFARETGLFDSKVFNGFLDDIRHNYWNDPGNLIEGSRDLNKARMGIVRQALFKVNCDNEKLAESIVKRFSVLKMEMTDFMPDAESTINHLKEQGIKLAVLTNGEGKEQRARIERFRLSGLIHCCLIAGELGFGKPDQRIFQMALSQLNVKPKETWMVGDRLEQDIMGAKNMGIFAIWFDHEHKGLPPDAKTKPDRVITRIEELLTI